MSKAGLDQDVFIELRQVHKTLGWQHILRGVDLKVMRGETLVIIGPSGEGKTVMMKHVIGLMRADSGEVIVDGVHMEKMREREMRPIRAKVSMMFQNAALFENAQRQVIEAQVKNRRPSVCDACDQVLTVFRHR